MLGVDTAVGTSKLLVGTWYGRTVYWPPGSVKCGYARRHAAKSTNIRLRARMAADRKEGKEPAAERPVAVLIRRRPRKGKAVRVINNNLEVAEALQDVGWNVAMFDDEDHLSIESACKLFNSAELILGPHGAGFTNMLCACGGTTIIEFLQSDSMRNPSFIILAKELDFNYIAIETLPPYILPYKGGEGLVNSTLIAAVSAGVLEERNRGQRKRQC